MSFRNNDMATLLKKSKLDINRSNTLTRPPATVPFINPPTLTNNDYRKLCNLIYILAGIKLNGDKKSLLTSRLGKIIHDHGMSSFSEYIALLENSADSSKLLSQLIDAITTNKTGFFREPQHFDYLTRVLIPQYINTQNHKNNIKVWSAACSTGEEPYSLSMCFHEFKNKYKYDFKILASDICEKVLVHASVGTYNIDNVRPIPRIYLHKYFSEMGKQYKVKPVLKNNIIWKKINLISEFHTVIKDVDIVFCRNVLIYFDKKTQQKIIEKFWRSIVPGGYLFVGHSESLHGLNHPFEYVLPAVYRRNTNPVSKR